MPVHLNIMVRIEHEREANAYFAYYRCPDPKCDKDHIIGSVAGDVYKNVPGVQELFLAFVRNTIAAMASQVVGAKVDLAEMKKLDPDRN